MHAHTHARTQLGQASCRTVPHEIPTKPTNMEQPHLLLSPPPPVTGNPYQFDTLPPSSPPRPHLCAHHPSRPCKIQPSGCFLDAMLIDPKSAPRVPTSRMAGLPIAARLLRLLRLLWHIWAWQPEPRSRAAGQNVRRLAVTVLLPACLVSPIRAARAAVISSNSAEIFGARS
jgi:hypothetical protein